MLTGIRVVDFSQYLPGPYTTLRLVDLGADVIKVEQPAGDPVRFPLEQDQGEGYTFRAQNRGKKSIVLNLKESEDQKIVLDLIREADVVVESFRPGVTSRLGINYEQVSKVNPRVVYCSISGYGQAGSMNHLGSHDINYMALSGVLSQLKDKTGRPIHPSITLADLIGGIAASESILAGMIQRGKTGKGTYLDIALVDVMLTLMNNHVLIESGTGNPYGVPFLNKKVICYFIYETADRRFVSLAALEPKFWNEFCEAVGRNEWIPVRLTEATEDNLIFHEVKQLFKSRTFSDWVAFSQEVDCCMAPVLETGELYSYPYFKQKGLIKEKWGLRQTLTRYIEKKETSLKAFTSPPKLGEHTVEVLNQLNQKR